jgi:hypothetical protein
MALQLWAAAAVALLSPRQTLMAVPAAAVLSLLMLLQVEQALQGKALPVGMLNFMVAAAADTPVRVAAIGLVVMALILMLLAYQLLTVEEVALQGPAV